MLADEDEQTLGVAPHARGEVVEFEELGEGVGVEFLVLQAGDEAELAPDEALVAAAEVGQGLGGVAAQHGLLGGEADGCALDAAQRGGDLGDLLGAAQSPSPGARRCLATSAASRASASRGRVMEREASSQDAVTRATASRPAARYSRSLVVASSLSCDVRVRRSAPTCCCTS